MRTIKQISDERERLSSYLHQINDKSKEVLDKINSCQRTILAKVVRDQRSNGIYNTGVHVFSEILWAGLKSIPMAGGYFSLAQKVMSDPLKGAYAVSRTQYGSHWGYDNANQVMSPLSVDNGNGTTSIKNLSGYNLGATGGPRISAFNSDPDLKIQQFEADLHGMVNTSKLYAVKQGKNMTTAQVNLSQDIGIDQADKLMLGEWKVGTLTTLSHCETNEWLWYNWALMLGTMYDEHNGLKDFDNGIFNVGTEKDPVLASSANVNSISKDSKLSSSHGGFHRTLENYQPGDWWWNFDRIKAVTTAATRYRVCSAKAKIVAYLTEVRAKMAEDISSHIYDLIDNNAKLARRTCGDASYSRNYERNLHKVGIACTIPFRLLGAIMPKKIYNYRTTSQSKEWARFLCAIHVFYTVLTAYLDVALPCDLLPSRRNYELFVIAYTDAYNTATHYFYHKGLFGYTGDRWAGEDLQLTLKHLLHNDPGIKTFITNLAIKKDQERQVQTDSTDSTLIKNRQAFQGGNKTLGLSEFSHLGRLFGSYDTEKGFLLAEVDIFIQRALDEAVEKVQQQKAAAEQEALTHAAIETEDARTAPKLAPPPPRPTASGTCKAAPIPPVRDASGQLIRPTPITTVAGGGASSGGGGGGAAVAAPSVKLAPPPPPPRPSRAPTGTTLAARANYRNSVLQNEGIAGIGNNDLQDAAFTQIESLKTILTTPGVPDYVIHQFTAMHNLLMEILKNVAASPAP